MTHRMPHRKDILLGKIYNTRELLDFQCFFYFLKEFMEEASVACKFH